MGFINHFSEPGYQHVIEYYVEAMMGCDFDKIDTVGRVLCEHRCMSKVHFLIACWLIIIIHPRFI